MGSGTNLLFLINHGYFYESFFRPIIFHLSKNNQIFVWFDDDPSYFREESFSVALEDKNSGYLAEVRSISLKSSRRPALGLRGIVKILKREKLGLDHGSSRDFAHVFSLNSSLPANLAFLEKLVSSGSMLTVLRPMTIENNFRLIFSKSRQLEFFRIGKYLGPRIVLMIESLRSIIIQVLRQFYKPSTRNRKAGVVGIRSSETLLLTVNLRRLPEFIRNSSMYGLKDWLESIFLFANTRITHTVLVPNASLSNVMCELAPGPTYSSFGPGHGDRGKSLSTIALGICAPPSDLSRENLSVFIDEVLELLASRKWSKVSFREHPRSGSFPNWLLSKLQDNFINGKIVLSKDSFDLFAREHSHFVMPNSNTSLPVVLKMHNPYSKCMMTRTRVASSFSERYEIEHLNEWVSTFEEMEQVESPSIVGRTGSGLRSNLDIFQALDSIVRGNREENAGFGFTRRPD